MKTQQEVSKTIGINDTAFGRVLSGERDLQWLTAVKLADTLECPPHIWIKGGGTSAQRREAWWSYLLTLEKGG